MKKVVGVALIGALVVVGTLVAKSAPNLSILMSEEGKTCVRLGELCDAPKSGDNLDQCVANMKQMRKMSGDPAFERTRKCLLEEATSCGAAAGCMAGGVGVGAVGEMLKGLGSALSQ
jgi:hypothetical protein